jgi:hypothetical protein
MTFETLIDFIKDRISMRHIYQPLMIRSLIEAGGYVKIRQLAQSFLTQDETQLVHYERRIKEMPLRVLRKREIDKKDGEFVSLNVKKFSFE